jgi:hypothetical protein
MAILMYIVLRWELCFNIEDSETGTLPRDCSDPVPWDCYHVASCKFVSKIAYSKTIQGSHNWICFSKYNINYWCIYLENWNTFEPCFVNTYWCVSVTIYLVPMSLQSRSIGGPPFGGSYGHVRWCSGWPAHWPHKFHSILMWLPEPSGRQSGDLGEKWPLNFAYGHY